jgi:hypothetical protein
MWSIWNEPNHPQFLGPQYRRGKPYSPRLYRRLFQAADRALAATGNRRDRVLMGETAPRGNGNVVHPLRFLRGALCLNSRYRKRRGCSKLPADGYAHHPYTTRAGPFFVSRRRDDVTIGSLRRLTRALDRAGRVRAISQYLMRDDLPRRGSNRYGGFESGLRFSNGRRKIAYRGFRLPLVARRAGRRVRLWGHVRPHDGRERVVIEYRRRGGAWRRLKARTTDGRGYFATSTRYRRGRSYRLRWRSYSGSPTRPIRWG